MTPRVFRIIPTTSFVESRIKQLPTNRWVLMEETVWHMVSDTQRDLVHGEPAMRLKSVDVASHGEHETRWVASRNVEEIIVGAVLV